jgi:Domain of unknown function (DUF3806)
MTKFIVNEPTAEDLRYLGEAQVYVSRLLRENYADVSLTQTQEDLVNTQRLFKDKIIGKKDTAAGACIGVVLGNVFTATTSMEWKRVIDETYGNRIAICSSQIGWTLYPIEMIPKRQEDDRDIDLLALYLDLSNSLNIRK